MQGPWLVVLGEALTSWSGIITVALLIVGFALFHAVRFLRAIRPRIAHVASACEQLEASEGGSGFRRQFL